MGDGNLKKVQNGEDTLSTKDFSQLSKAFSQDMGCRNDLFEGSGGAGNLGTQANPFENIRTQAGVYNRGTKIEREYFATGTFTVPDRIHAIHVIAGGGGCADISGNDGAGGGTAIAWVPVTPGDVFDIVISSNNADFDNGTLKGWGATSVSTSEKAGWATGDWQLMPLLIAGGGRFTGANRAQGTIFAQAGAGTSAGAHGGAGFKAGGSGSGGAGGGYTAASGATPGAAGVRITYYLQSDVVDNN